jgi:protein-S-isoprenylcysteine O-methyltransferase Ste14
MLPAILEIATICIAEQPLEGQSRAVYNALVLAAHVDGAAAHMGDRRMPISHENRGEAWVVAQVGIVALAAAAPRWEGQWPPAPRRMGRAVGVPLALVGATFLAAGSRQLGRNLTPLPRPKATSVLVHDGIYGVVRHPIYSGLIFVLLGSALATGRVARLALACGAIGFFDAKARREEKWLVDQFPEYPAYRQRVRKLIPALY